MTDPFFCPDRGLCTRPSVTRGAQIARVFVGPEKKEFAIHKNLLVAASDFFHKALNRPFTEGSSQEVSLPEHDAEVFELFCDWLYAHTWVGLIADSRALSTIKQSVPDDMCWLKVFQLADSLLIPGLQLDAYNCIISLFSQHPNDTVDRSPSPKSVRMPSRGFLSLLFDGAYPLALQMHVVEHVVYFLPKSANEAAWVANFTVDDRYGTEIALGIVRSHLKQPFLHPSQRESFAEDHGLDLLEWAEEATAANEEPNNVKEVPMRTFLIIF